MRRDDLRFGVPKVTVVDRRLGCHHFVERRVVLVEVPELQPALPVLNVLLRVQREVFEPPRQLVEAGLGEERTRRICQNLQCGEALLAVDDVPRRQTLALRLVGLDDDRPEEVGSVQVGLGDAQLRNPADVLPERFPLLCLLPDVRTLEKRDHEMLRQVEQLQRRPLEGLHGLILLAGPTVAGRIARAGPAQPLDQRAEWSDYRPTWGLSPRPGLWAIDSRSSSRLSCACRGAAGGGGAGRS